MGNENWRKGSKLRNKKTGKTAKVAWIERNKDFNMVKLEDEGIARQDTFENAGWTRG